MLLLMELWTDARATFSESAHFWSTAAYLKVNTIAGSEVNDVQVSDVTVKRHRHVRAIITSFICKLLQSFLSPVSTGGPRTGRLLFSGASREDLCVQVLFILTTQAWKQTSGDPSGQTLHQRGVTLLYNFTTALLYMVSSVTIARIVARLLNIYYSVKIKNK